MPLNVANNQITDKGACALAKNTSIFELEMSINFITAKATTALAENCSLNTLDLSVNDIDDKGGAILASSTSLTALSIALNDIRDDNTYALIDDMLVRNRHQLSALKNEVSTLGQGLRGLWRGQGDWHLPADVTTLVSEKLAESHGFFATKLIKSECDRNLFQLKKHGHTF